MASPSCFVFDLGNVVVRLAYDRVLAAVEREARAKGGQLAALMEAPGGYRDLESGAVTFAEFHQYLRDLAGFRGDIAALRRIWTDFFDGPVEGIEEVLRRVRERYRVAFLSNSNEVHAAVIPQVFAQLFREDDRFVFSHRLRVAKPDRAIFEKLLEALSARAPDVLYTDDMPENVETARQVGIRAYLFRGSRDLLRRLEADGLLSPDPRTR